MQTFDKWAYDALVEEIDKVTVEDVLEIGVGRGAFAERLLTRYGGGIGRYVGTDASPHNVSSSRNRLRRFDSAEVTLASGSSAEVPAGQQFDLVVSTYVLDILSSEHIELFVESFYSSLRSGGTVCILSATEGNELVSKVVMHLWKSLHRLHPAITGGTRPVSLVPFFCGPKWTIVQSKTIGSCGFASELIVVAKNSGTADDHV